MVVRPFDISDTGRRIIDEVETQNKTKGGSYSLTFFSEKRLSSLSARLQNNKVNELVKRINGVINGRLRRTEPVATEESIIQPNPAEDAEVDKNVATKYIECKIKINFGSDVSTSIALADFERLLRSYPRPVPVPGQDIVRGKSFIPEQRCGSFL